MTDKFTGIYLVMKRMDCLPVDTIDKLQILQGSIYLLQARGIDLHFCFDWATFGDRNAPHDPAPGWQMLYSRHLAETADDILKEHEEEDDDSRLRNGVSEVVESIKRAADSAPPELGIPRWLALLCAICHLGNSAMPGERIGLGNVKSLLPNHLPPGATAEHIDLAWSCLRTLGVTVCNSAAAD